MSELTIIKVTTYNLHLHVRLCVSDDEKQQDMD